MFPAYNDVSMYNVYGDISALANCTKLVYIYLNNCKVTGDISVFATLPSLLIFNMQRTNVYGNLSSLKTYKGYYVGVIQTQVIGDIANLSNMSDKHLYSETYSFITKNKLDYYNNMSPNQFTYQPLHVNLSYTSISGDISTFANKDVLILNVNNFKVSHHP